MPFSARRINQIVLIVTGLLVFTWAGARAATIVTVGGEQIVCNIVEERDDYVVIDHRGYRRYVLKSQIRTINRANAVTFDPNPLRRRTIGIFSGYYMNAEAQEQDLKGVRMSFTQGVHRHIALEANLHYGQGRINSTAGSKLLPGDMKWYGAMLGVLWNARTWGAYSYVETAGGYMEVDHKIDEVQRTKMLIVNRAADIVPEGQEGYFEQDPHGGYAIMMSLGSVYPITNWLMIEGRMSYLVVDAQNRDVVTYLPIADDPDYSTGKHVNTYELMMQQAQFSLGLRFAF